MKRGRLFLLVILAALFIGGTVALGIAGKTEWSAAIQAGASLILVGVTGVYAYLTFRLVKAQEKAPRVAGREQALRDLMKMISEEARPAMGNLRVLFPLTDTNGLLAAHGQLPAFGSLSPKFMALSSQLPPDLMPLAGLAAIALSAASTMLQEYMTSVMQEQAAALREHRDFSWDSAQAVYDEMDRDEVAGAFTSTWDEVQMGKPLEDALRVVHNLEDRAQQLLQAD